MTETDDENKDRCVMLDMKTLDEAPRSAGKVDLPDAIFGSSPARDILAAHGGVSARQTAQGTHKVKRYRQRD